MIEELEKEAEEWVKNNSYPYSNCPNIEKKLKQAYFASAEPREKHIAELEADNAELKKDKQNLRADLRTARNNLQAKNTAYQLAMEELNYAKTHCLFHSDCPTQKENAELQEKYDTCLRENTGLKIHSAYVEKKFTKAKEIIKSLRVCLLDFDEDTIEPYKQYIDEAEAFLKE